MRLGGIWDTVTDWVGNTARDGVKTFREKRAKLQANYDVLKQNPPPFVVSQEIMNEYDQNVQAATDALNRAQTVDNAIKKIESTLGINLGSLGFVQFLIPAAVVTGIIGVVYLMTDVIDRSDAFIRERLGMKPPQEKSGLFGDASKLVWPIAIVIGGLFLLRNSRRGNR